MIDADQNITEALQKLFPDVKGDDIRMSIGEVVSALALCASSFDDDKDRLLMLKNVYEIEVRDDYILVYFVDANTRNIKVYKDGKREYLS